MALSSSDPHRDNADEEPAAARSRQACDSAFLRLPPDVVSLTASFLDGRCLAALEGTSRCLRRHFSGSSSFWVSRLSQYGYATVSSGGAGSTSQEVFRRRPVVSDDLALHILQRYAGCAAAAGETATSPNHFSARSRFLMLDHALRLCSLAPALLPALFDPAARNSVRRMWAPREAHVACTLSDGIHIYTQGGFCEDAALVLVLNYATGTVSGCWQPEIVEHGHGPAQGGGVPPRTPLVMPPVHAYGHRATVINASDDVLHFGGCTQGGYRGMVSELAVLSPLDADSTFASPGGLGLFRGITFDLGHPELGFQARGYHGQTTDSERRRLYLFGGLLETGAVDNTLLVIDLEALAAAVRDARRLLQQTPGTFGQEAHRMYTNAWRSLVVGSPVVLHQISPRFGHSMVASPSSRELIVAGGYTGSGMFDLHDGVDLYDINTFDPETGVVRRVISDVSCISRLLLGRCHAAVTFGPYVVYVGGTSYYSSFLCWFDTRDFTTCVSLNGTVMEDVAGSAFAERAACRLRRVSHTATLCGAAIVVLGGCGEGRSVRADFAFELAPPPTLKSATTQRVVAAAARCEICRIAVSEVESPLLPARVQEVAMRLRVRARQIGVDLRERDDETFDDDDDDDDDDDEEENDYEDDDLGYGGDGYYDPYSDDNDSDA